MLMTCSKIVSVILYHMPFHNISCVRYDAEHAAVIPADEDGAGIINAVDRAVCSHRWRLRIIHPEKFHTGAVRISCAKPPFLIT